MDKLTIEDCEKAIAALGTSQMKDSLMARSLMYMHKQLANTMRREAKLREELESVANCAYVGEGGSAKELLNELYHNKDSGNAC